MRAGICESCGVGTKVEKHQLNDGEYNLCSGCISASEILPPQHRNLPILKDQIAFEDEIGKNGCGELWKKYFEPKRPEDFSYSIEEYFGNNLDLLRQFKETERWTPKTGQWLRC